MAYLLLHDNEDTLEAKQNSLAVCALLHRIGILGTGLEETKEGEAEKRLSISYLHLLRWTRKRSGRCYVMRW